MELFILTVKPIENKYARTLIFFAYICCNLKYLI